MVTVDSLNKKIDNFFQNNQRKLKITKNNILLVSIIPEAAKVL